VGPWDVGAVAEGTLMIEFWKETSEGDVPGVIMESIVVTFRRLLASMLVIVGREIVDGSDVILVSVRSDKVDGRLVILLIVGSDNVEGRIVRLLIVGIDMVDGRTVTLLIVGSENFDGRAVMLVMGDDIPEIDRLGSEVMGFVSTIG
jgi:hypothetical protein